MRADIGWEVVVYEDKGPTGVLAPLEWAHTIYRKPKHDLRIVFKESVTLFFTIDGNECFLKFLVALTIKDILN
jgi:hypothetical protein